jgi:transposase-like protein
MSDSKTCSKCSIEKSLEEFHKKKSSKDGYNPRCKECRKKYQEENKEQIKEYNKKWEEENKENRKESGKTYRETNKEKTKEYNQK